MAITNNIKRGKVEVELNSDDLDAIKAAAKAARKLERPDEKDSS